MNKKIKFMLPGLYEHFKLNSLIIKLFKDHPEKFYDNISFGCLYGNFQFCAWDGGRTFSQYHHSTLEDIINIRDYLLSENIPLRLIFTNPMIKEEHLTDHFCNLVASICENEKNEIVVNSKILENYLRKNYPKYSFISSTTKCESLNNYIKVLDEYKYTCIDYNSNKNFKILNELNQNQKNKIEFLINAICPPGCPNRKEHYRLNGLSHLTLGKSYNINCSIKENTVNFLTCNYNNNISPEEIYDTYYKLGFYNFKLEGRTLSDLEVLLNYVRYFIKPEYEYEVICSIYQQLENEKYCSNF